MRILPAFAALLMASTVPLAAGEIEAVTLSSGGLAEIRMRDRVEGDGVLSLRVPHKQIDDVLKSLVVFDPSGTVGGVALDGPEPGDEPHHQDYLPPEALSSAAGLLEIARGAEVTITSGGKSLTGLSLGVSREGEKHVASLLQGARMVSIELGADAGVEIVDPVLRERVAEATARARRQWSGGRRNVDVTLSGSGARDVTLSYVVQAPAWKTAYRLVTEADGKSRLQAWAVLENTTGEDWKGVRVSLSSGAPVTFEPDLYRRHWVARGRLGGPVLPQAQRQAEGGAAADSMETQVMAESAPASAPLPRGKMAAPSDPVAATEGEVAALYQLPKPVDLAAGRTLSVPITDARLDAERVSVFDASRSGRHPVAAIMFRNETGVSLPPGIMTVYDEAEGYSGDARFGRTAPGRRAEAVFAEDGKVRVDRNRDRRAVSALVSSADGVARVRVTESFTTRYRIEGAADEGRTLIIRENVPEGWTFSAKDGFEADGRSHLVRIALEAGENREVTTVRERVRFEAVRLEELDQARLSELEAGASDPAMRERLAGVISARRDLAAVERELGSLSEEHGRIAAEQQRLRENLKSVPEGGDLATRYLQRLTAQETRLEEIEAARGRAAEKREDLRRRLGDAIAAL